MEGFVASGASNAKMPPSMQKSKNSKKRDFTHHSLAGDFNFCRFTLDESTTRSVSKKHYNLIDLSRPVLKGFSERTYVSQSCWSNMVFRHDGIEHTPELGLNFRKVNVKK